MVTKFKVGDIVIGNAKARCYSITKTGWIGKVVRVYDDRYIDVIQNGSDYLDRSYLVLPEHFDLFETPNAVSEQTEKEFEDLIFR